MKTIQFWAKVPMVLCALLAAAAEATKLEADTEFLSNFIYHDRNKLPSDVYCASHSKGGASHCTKHWFWAKDGYKNVKERCRWYSSYDDGRWYSNYDDVGTSLSPCGYYDF